MFTLLHMHVNDIVQFVNNILQNSQEKHHTVFIGDFNFDMLQNGDAHKRLVSFMQTNNFMLHTTKGTTNMGSMRDHFWTNISNGNIAFEIFEAYWTDHHAIFLSIPLLALSNTSVQ